MNTKFNIKAFALGIAVVFSATACNDWLNVNTDPDNPNSSSAVLENRLPWIQRNFTYTDGVSNMRASAMAGAMYSTNANVGNSACAWNGQAGLTTTPYQTFFCMCGNNLKDMEVRADAEGATHYKAAAKVVRAMAFMNMVDLYGEMPCSEAFMSIPTPKYDSGKDIYNFCMSEIEEAITLFSAPQKAGATPLSAGDMWCDGNADKWLKLCYGLKARYLLRVSKHADIFDAQAVIDAANKAMTSIDDNVVMKCYNVEGEVTDWLLGDPIQTNGNWDYVAYGNTQRMSKFFYDKLVNARNAGIVDPRMEKIVPAIMTDIVLDANGVVSSYKWERSIPVDVYDDANGRLALGVTSIVLPSYAETAKSVTYAFDGAPSEDKATFKAQMEADTNRVESVGEEGNAIKVTYKAGAHYVTTANYKYADDWKYVSLISSSTSTGTKLNGVIQDIVDLNYYAQKAPAARQAGAVASTGSYQVRAISDFEIMCYDEICFIKAEAYFRLNDKGKAQTCYKDGIQAHMDRMQASLRGYEASGYTKYNPDMAPMDDAKIAEFMNSAAVCQDASITMADIMEQKYIAMGFHLENWNDVRRFNYSAGNVGDFGVVYPGIHKPAQFNGPTKITGTSPTDLKAWPRRFRLPDKLELQYNMNMALQMNAHCLDEDIWCYPVWWDCETDEQYEEYLK